MLVRCLYASRAAEGLDADRIQSILEQSRENNPGLGVTGLLCYGDDVFIQVLEGGRDEVCELYNAIAKDDRHTNVRILVFEEISERMFGNWKMGQVDLERINRSLLLKYSEKPRLDPFSCSGTATMSLLKELVATGSIITK
jgi:hypothetical protein